MCRWLSVCVSVCVCVDSDECNNVLFQRERVYKSRMTDAGSDYLSWSLNSVQLCVSVRVCVYCRCEGDRYCCHPGAPKGPESGHGPDQGIVLVSLSLSLHASLLVSLPPFSLPFPQVCLTFEVLLPVSLLFLSLTLSQPLSPHLSFLLSLPLLFHPYTPPLSFNLGKL